MLTNQDLHEEIDALDKQCESMEEGYEKASLKTSILLLKLVHNIRTNQVSIMKAQNIPLKKIEKKQDTNATQG